MGCPLQGTPPSHCTEDLLSLLLPRFLQNAGRKSLKSEPHSQTRSKARGGRTRRGGSEELEGEREARSQTTRESVGRREAGDPEGRPGGSEGRRAPRAGRRRRARRRARAAAGRAAPLGAGAQPGGGGARGGREGPRSPRLRPTGERSPPGDERLSPARVHRAARTAPAPSAPRPRVLETRRRRRRPPRGAPGAQRRDRAAGCTRLPQTSLQQVGAAAGRRATGHLAEQPRLRVWRSAGGRRTRPCPAALATPEGARCSHLRRRVPSPSLSVEKGGVERRLAVPSPERDAGRCVNARAETL